MRLFSCYTLFLSVFTMFVLGFVCLMHVVNIEASDQDYEVTLSYPMADRSMDVVDTSRVHVERYNDSASSMKGEIDLKKDLDEYTYMELIAQREESGDLETVLSVAFNLCEEMDKGEDSEFHDLFSCYDFQTCPIKSGTYTINKDMVHDRKEKDGEKKPDRIVIHINLFNKQPDKDREYIHMLTVDIVRKEE